MIDTFSSIVFSVWTHLCFWNYWYVQPFTCPLTCQQWTCLVGVCCAFFSPFIFISSWTYV